MATNANIAQVPELRNRILFTIGILIVFRIGSFIPTPGINPAALAEFFAANNSSLLSFINMFSGGSLERFSIFALGIMPYITVSIVIQVLADAFPALAQLRKEGELGRRKLNQYTRYGTIILALGQAYFMAQMLESFTAPRSGTLVVTDPGMGFRLLTMVTFATGTMFMMWLGELIAEKGIGNGISMLIFAGIVVQIPSAITKSYQLIKTGEVAVVPFILLLALMLAALAGIVFMETAVRKIPIQYAKRVTGRKVYGGQNTHLPLRVNIAGVIPPIFASSLLMFPLTFAQFSDSAIAQQIQEFLRFDGIWYNLIFSLLIIFFAYFYIGIIYNPNDVADNLQKSGGFIPGIRPGQQTADRIDFVIGRLTLIGAVYLIAVCVLPVILIRNFDAPFMFGGTSILIVIGVALDTMRQIESSMIAHSYDGLMGQGQAIRGRRRLR